ncbi:hypothetical protein DPEC_G00231920 [Dallia pectoralis]|uniref:Uncharacterized protein n=1 Tax=Dallia pectoralis TaxID=75939 RepID=A0ACC2FXC8_DALPE|nr:hypothetical protein DPEC_G00231920 [Dallia pectoralis]
MCGCFFDRCEGVSPPPVVRHLTMLFSSPSPDSQYQQVDAPPPYEGNSESPSPYAPPTTTPFYPALFVVIIRETNHTHIPAIPCVTCTSLFITCSMMPSGILWCSNTGSRAIVLGYPGGFCTPSLTTTAGSCQFAPPLFFDLP